MDTLSDSCEFIKISVLDALSKGGGIGGVVG